MLVDEVVIKISAGKGGDGKVNFRREKYVPKGGPDGGDGGDGGDFYLIGVEDITALRRFRYQKEFSAENGENGSAKLKTGTSGKDLEINVPVGTVIRILGTERSWEIKKIGEKILLAKGGKGGRGNWHFKSSTHQTPMEYEQGGAGQEMDLSLELRLIADIGLIGLPSVGKSSLLNELTKAHAKVASYNFTTLEPNLGVMENGLIIADLPGLIEGAHEGKGLGIKFLKHVERTKVLLHCVGGDSSTLLKDYETIRKELGEFDKKLLERPEIILVTKSDLVLEAEMKKIKSSLKKTKKEIIVCSIYDYDSLEKLKEKLKDYFSGDKEN